MKFEANLICRRGHTCALMIDFEAQHVWFVGDPKLEIDETYGSFRAMDRVYREVLVPYFVEHQCRDIDHGGSVEVFEDLDAFRAELAARRTGEAIAPGADPLDAGIITFSNALRECLNRAIGPEPLTLHCAVFHLSDGGIVGATLNGALLVGKSREEIRRAVDRHPHGGWAGEDFRGEAALSLELSDLFTPFEELGDASNLADELNHHIFELACTRIEHDPALRSNVTIGPELRVFWEHHEIGGVDWPSREAAAAFADRPAREYFAHAYDS